MAAQNPNVRFLFGIILIFCGWVICFDLFKLIFGIPFFLLGCILVLFSKKSWLTKGLIIGIPIVLWIVGFKFLMNMVNRKDVVSVIVPKDFSGQARVVYGEPNGVIPENKNGRMILDVPANGILVIRPFLNPDAEKIEYYHFDAKGVPVKMNAVKEGEEKNALRPAAFYEGIMSGDSASYIYAGFFVLGNDSVKALSQAEERVKNPLTDSLVKVVRAPR